MTRARQGFNNIGCKPRPLRSQFDAKFLKANLARQDRIVRQFCQQGEFVVTAMVVVIHVRNELDQQIRKSFGLTERPPDRPQFIL